MTGDLQSARDDLAYMRTLIGGTARMQATIGEAFFWAGLLYGAQCFLHFLQTQRLAPESGLAALSIAWAPTLIFVALLTFIIWKDRKTPSGGPASRALGAVFQGAGIANLVMAFVFVYGAVKFETPGLWFYHPIVVCMFQGVAWFVAYTILRKLWVGAVAAGWIVTTVALGIVVGDAGAFVLVLAVALVLLMALPGYAMWRGAKRA